MIINTDKETLLKSVSVADSIVSPKNINTLLSSCLFKVSENQIEILSTDNEIAVRTKLDAVSEGNALFAVSGKKLAGILKELPNDEIVMDINDSMTIKIKTMAKEVKGSYSIIGTSGEDYPEIPAFEENNCIEIEQNVLRDMIKKVVYAASHDSIKPVFNGIFFTIENGNEITAVATDSKRLSMITRKLDAEFKPETVNSFIIPLKTVGELLKLLESAGRCRFSFNERQCFFKIGNTEIISRVVDGQFPNYKHIIPADFSIVSVIETKKITDTVRRAMIFSKEPFYQIVCTFDGNSLIVQSSSESGEAEELIEIENQTGGTMKIGLNSQFLLDCLRETGSFSFRCSLTGTMSPVTVVPEDDDSYISVIMPMNLKS